MSAPWHNLPSIQQVPETSDIDIKALTIYACTTSPGTSPSSHPPSSLQGVPAHLQHSQSSPVLPHPWLQAGRAPQNSPCPASSHPAHAALSPLSQEAPSFPYLTAELLPLRINLHPHPNEIQLAAVLCPSLSINQIQVWEGLQTRVGADGAGTR